MANTFRIKRRVSGAPGAPASLLNGELAYNEVDNILYYGKGVASGVIAAAVIAIGGSGMTVNLSGDQSVDGVKTFTSSPLMPTPSGVDNSTKGATTAWVRGFAQAASAALTTFAAHATAGMLVQTSSGNYASRTLTGTGGNIAVANGDGVSGNPTINLIASGVSTGTFSKVTVDTYGRVTVGAQLASGDITTALGFTPIDAASRGANNGVATLDSGGKIPIGQLPASVTGGLNYVGVWNASTNTPTLVNGAGTKGQYYKVSVPGDTTIDGNNNWTAGDLIVFNGSTWDKAEGGGPDVISVAGRIGAITLTYSDIGGLASMAQQAASAVAITGGTIDNITLDGGTF